MSDSLSSNRRDRLLKDAFGYREALLAQAFAMLRDWAAAEDAVQDAFLVVVNKHESFREGTSLLNWTRQIVRNKCHEIIRARRREFAVEDEALEHAVSQALEEQLTERMAEGMAEQRQILEACMAKLGEKAVSLLAGFYVDMKSCEVLGRMYRRSANAIRLTLSRTRRALKDCTERKARMVSA